MKKASLAIAVTTFIIISHAVSAGADCLSTVNESKLKEAINEKKSSYGDVPSTVNCKKPANGADKLICSDSVLTLMEKLDSVAYVYASESATGQEVNHKKTKDTDWIKTVRNKSKDKSSLCEAFKEHTNGSLGGMSPYEEGN